MNDFYSGNKTVIDEDELSKPMVPAVQPVRAVTVPPQNQDDEIEIDLVELMYLLWDHIFIIILMALIGAGIAFAYTWYLVTPMYTATAKMYILSSSSNSVVNLSDLQISSSLRSDYQELLTSRPVLEKVIASLNLDYTYTTLSQAVTVTNPKDTRILNVTVTTPSPQLSADIANQLVKQGQQDLPAIMKTEEPSIFEDAIVPTRKSSPSFTKNTVIGALLAAMLYCGILVFRHITNDTVITPDDVYRITGIQPLATIPEGNLGNFNGEIRGKKNKKARKAAKSSKRKTR